jgi:hypothetical protein
MSNPMIEMEQAKMSNSPIATAATSSSSSNGQASGTPIPSLNASVNNSNAAIAVHAHSGNIGVASHQPQQHVTTQQINASTSNSSGQIVLQPAATATTAPPSSGMIHSSVPPNAINSSKISSNETSTASTSTPQSNGNIKGNGKNLSIYTNSSYKVNSSTSIITNATSTTNSNTTNHNKNNKPTSGGAVVGNTIGKNINTLSQSQMSRQSPNPKINKNNNNIFDTKPVILSEDEKMKRFFTLLSARQKFTTTVDNTTTRGKGKGIASSSNHEIGPTVPQSLSRRILNKQGVNYMDENVTSLLSGAADRFLATILQQSLICRDRRLLGEEMAKKERKSIHKMKKRRRDERKREEAKKQKLEKELETAIQKSTTTTTGKKNTVKKNNSSSAVTSELIHDVEKAFGGDEDNNYRDEEMEYYDKNLNLDDKDEGGANEQAIDDDTSDEDENDEDDDDEFKETLQLRDVVRPLDAWGISLTGKIGLTATPYNNADVIKNHQEIAPDDDSNADAEGDLDGNGDYEDDDDISMSGASATGSSKTHISDKKRILSPKGSNLKSPSKPRKVQTPNIDASNK